MNSKIVSLLKPLFRESAGKCHLFVIIHINQWPVCTLNCYQVFKARATTCQVWIMYEKCNTKRVVSRSSSGWVWLIRRTFIRTEIKWRIEIKIASFYRISSGYCRLTSIYEGYDILTLFILLCCLYWLSFLSVINTQFEMIVYNRTSEKCKLKKEKRF